MGPRVRDVLPGALVCVLALLYGWVGVASGGWDRVWGIGGGALLAVALVLARRSPPAAVVVLVVGALPLAMATWWSLATPLLALLAVALGVVAIRSGPMVPKVLPMRPVDEPLQGRPLAP